MKALSFPPLLACAAALLSACSSVPTHYHSLTQTQETSHPPQDGPGGIDCRSDSATAADPTRPIGTLLLAHLAVPPEADRMQLVLHKTPTRLALYETERWATPLRDQISILLIDNLRARLPQLSITSDPLLTGTGEPVQLNVDIEELDALAGKEATVRARWRLSDAGNTASRAGTCTARQPLQNTEIDALVLAWSRALADISSALADSIQRWNQAP